MNKLIYVMDPLCGWCFGNSQNMLAIKEEFAGKFEFEIIMGGMRIPPNTQTGGPQLSQFMKEHGPPIVHRLPSVMQKRHDGAHDGTKELRHHG